MKYKILLSIFIIIFVLLSSGCLNFMTNSAHIPNNEIEKKYIGVYQDTITTKYDNGHIYNSSATVTVYNGSVININIFGGISLIANIYKENIIRISSNVYAASITSSGNKYDITFAFSNNGVNLNINCSDRSISSGNLKKIR